MGKVDARNFNAFDQPNICSCSVNSLQEGEVQFSAADAGEGGSGKSSGYLKVSKLLIAANV